MSEYDEEGGEEEAKKGKVFIKEKDVRRLRDSTLFGDFFTLNPEIDMGLCRLHETW